MTMQYTIILTETPEGGIRVTIPALPACLVEAANRDEAIRLAREAIMQFLSRSEMVQLDVPLPFKPPSKHREVPWEWFGAVKDDPAWDTLFEEIEQRREATRQAE
jgi:predicted RNase H-like HicB family nuclease